MSEEHVTAVSGPTYIRQARERERYELELARCIILALRRKLRDADPTLPNEYDGTAWMAIENIEPPPSP